MSNKYYSQKIAKYVCLLFLCVGKYDHKFLMQYFETKKNSENFKHLIL